MVEQNLTINSFNVKNYHLLFHKSVSRHHHIPAHSYIITTFSSLLLSVLTVCPVILPSQVNIDHFTKDVTLRNLVDISPTTFDLAQKRIYALMEKDSFGRFLRSDQYQELLVN